MLDMFEEIEKGREHPDSYWGAITDYQDQGWVLTFMRHRDSDNLDNSNFDAVLKTFEDKGFEVNEDYRVEGSSHWAVGWTDQMMVRALQCKCEDWEDAHITVHPDSRSKGLKLWRCHTCGTDLSIADIRPIFMECVDIAGRLSDYPVLDEEDYSRREYEELLEYIETEANSVIRRNEGDTIVEGFEAAPEDVFSILFDEHSVSSVDDCDYAWIEDAVLQLADKAGKKL